MPENFLRKCRIILDFQGFFLFNSPLRTTLTFMKRTSSFRFVRPVLATALAIVITSAFSIRTAQAGYIVTFLQIGPDVVATGSGSLDVTALSADGIGGACCGAVVPLFGTVITGFGPSGNQAYVGTITGPASFGSGFPATAANINSGDIVGIQGGGGGFLVVPPGYVSGAALADTSIYSGKSFASLGVTPGTYVWTWGTGVNQDSFKLAIGVPDSGSTFGLLLLSLVALFGVSRFRSLRLA